MGWGDQQHKKRMKNIYIYIYYIYICVHIFRRGGREIKAATTGHIDACYALIASNKFDVTEVDARGRTLADLAHYCNKKLEHWLWEHFNVGRWLGNQCPVF